MTGRVQGLYLVALVVSMVGVTYASVPLYRCASECCSMQACSAWHDMAWAALSCVELQVGHC